MLLLSVSVTRITAAIGYFDRIQGLNYQCLAAYVSTSVVAIVAIGVYIGYTLKPNMSGYRQLLMRI